MIVTRRAKQWDRILLGAVAIFLMIGILMVYSASSFRGAEKYKDSAFFLKQHLIRVAMGLTLLVIATKIDYHRYRWLTPMLLLVGMILLVAVLFGREYQGSKRAFLIMGKQFQPSEFMKLTLILYLAAVLSRGKRSLARNEKTIMSYYAVVLVIVGLVFVEPDLGTALVIFFIGYSMFLLSGISWSRLGKMALFLVPLVSMGMAIFPYQRQRLLDFLGSVFGKRPMSYHVKQSIIGLANGGFKGLGYGVGKQKHYFLPEPFSDFILACFGEEFGFIGIFVLFVLLAIVLWRGIRIALRAPDRFGFLLAGGITAMVLINALINACVVVNLFPTTGLPFPFVSYGGSSLLVHLLGVGILLNISKKRVLPYKDFTAYRGRVARWD